MSLIGIHISNINDLTDIIKNNKYLNNVNLIQIFVNCMDDYSEKKYENVIKYISRKNIKIVVHASYSINLSKRWNNNDWWVLQGIGEIIASSKINAFGIVIHTGKKLDLSNSEAINNMYSVLLHIHEHTKKHENIKILIETPSGQGTETLTNIKDFCNFMRKFYLHPNKKVRNRFGICIDTCHLFVSGHDIRTKNKMDNVFNIIDNIIGIQNIKLCHLNDAKNIINSKIDRHENIGKGKIGKDSILRIAKFMKFLQIPIILETPTKYLNDDYFLIKKL